MQSNIQITAQIIARGYFNCGLLFVLTNPSDLIAEYIFKSTGNENVFALGASVDYQRYQKMLQLFGINWENMLFQLCGTHGDYPFIDLKDNDDLKHLLYKNIGIDSYTGEEAESHLLLALREKLQSEIRKEFIGFKPPIKSGARAIINILSALVSNEQMTVSGMVPELAHFAIGSLDPRNFNFTSTRPQSPVCERMCSEIFIRHQRVYRDLMAMIKKEVL
jgi:malate/lactate dehydrogenase